MSVGNSALGTLLVQRLDAVLGTTMAQHANLISGARPDAVSQAGSVARLLGPEPTAPRNERETLERTRVDGIRGGAGKQVDQSSEQALRAAAGRLRQTSTAFTASAPTSLGVAARTILALLARFPEPAPPAAGRAPLWSPPAGAGPMPGGTAPAGPASGGAPAAPAAGPASAASAAGAAVTAQASAPGAAVLARALAQAVDASGLFYESHLAGLAFGRRTLAQLRNEPQAGLPAGTPNAQASVPAAARAQAGPAGTPGQAPGLPADAPARGEAAPPSGGPAAGGTPWPAAPAQGGVHPEASLLVRQQLEVLANQALAWRGEPWPDAQMHWEIRRETQQPEQPDPQAGWDTRLVLELPRLGKVQATLRLQGNQLLMRLSAEHSASLLQAESATLRERYAAAGFELVGLAVDRDAPPVPPGEAGP